ncbi:MAG: ATP synthase F1 subunit gamma [Acidobacteriota bacterium]
MANLRDLRRRIRSVRSTQQITKAMKMVSAARLRRAQGAILAARPYAHKLREMLVNVGAGAGADVHPLLSEREPRRVDLAVISTDRGLCGSFNTNVFKRAQAFAREQGKCLRGLHVIGRKARDYFRRREVPILSERLDLLRGLNHARAAEIARFLSGLFTAAQTDAVYVVYNEFKSLSRQRVVLERILPIERGAVVEERLERVYLFEPEAEKLFASLLPIHVEFQLFRVLLESIAAEHAARMSAMDSATRNASDMIDSLTLHLNRMRQAAITKELIEVVSGAEALA